MDGCPDPWRRVGLDSEQAAARAGLFLLTDKPVLAVVNVGEDQVAEADGLVKAVAAALGGGEVLAVSVQLEAEAAQLDPDERAELLTGLGLGDGALARVASAAYHLLGRRVFLTTGDKESRAWSFRAGATARAAPAQTPHWRGTSRIGRSGDGVDRVGRVHGVDRARRSGNPRR